MLEKKIVLKQFFNCQILRNGQILKEDLWIRNGKIIDPEKIFYDEKIVPDFMIDCHSALISPGYIDLQVNGKCFFILILRHNSLNISTSTTFIKYFCIKVGH